MLRRIAKLAALVALIPLASPAFAQVQPEYKYGDNKYGEIR